MMNNQQIRILIGDDHPIVRDGLTGLINSEPDMLVVAEAEDGLQLLDLFNKYNPDIVLVDLRMPRMDGIEATKAILKNSPEAQTIIFTTYDTDEEVYQAFKAGVKGYLLKSMFRKELLVAIKTVYEGKRYIPPIIADRLAGRLPDSALTPREMEVLKLIVDGKSNKEIGTELLLTEASVKTYVNRMLAKMGVTDRTQAAVAAIQRGIVKLN
jgi:two-component system, NarL family, response regulator